MKLKKISTKLLAVLLVIAVIATTSSVFSVFGVSLRKFFDSNKECSHTLQQIPGQAPTCTEMGWDAYYICEDCNYTTKTMKKPNGHNVSPYSMLAGEVCLNCRTCGLDQKFYGFNSYVDLIDPVDGNSANFSTYKGTEYPFHEDNNFTEFSYIKKTETNEYKQVQFWVPNEKNGYDEFSSMNDAVGFLSFSMNVNVSRSLEVMLVEGANNDRWSNTWCISDAVFQVKPTLYTEGYAEYSLIGCNSIELKRIVSTKDAFTGYFTVTIGMRMNKSNDTLELFYYLDGEYICTTSVQLTTEHNSIRSAYFSAKTAPIGSGIEFSDIYFGYSMNDTWDFDQF